MDSITIQKMLFLMPSGTEG